MSLGDRAGYGVVGGSGIKVRRDRIVYFPGGLRAAAPPPIARTLVGNCGLLLLDVCETPTANYVVRSGSADCVGTRTFAPQFLHLNDLPAASSGMRKLAIHVSHCALMVIVVSGK